MNLGLNEGSEQPKIERRAWAWPDTTYPLPITPCVWKGKAAQSKAAVLENLIAKKQFQKICFQTKQRQPPDMEAS